MNRRDVLTASAAVWLGGSAVANAKPTASKADPVIDAWVAETKFNGVIVLGRRGKTTWKRAYGWADVEAKTPMTLDTRFGIASISKWLTSITVLRLVEQGKMTLDDPISTHLKAFRADTGGKVKLRNLLANNSGIPNGFVAALKADKTQVDLKTSAEEAALKWAQGDLLFEPGANFDYHPTNWIVVEAMVEAVERRPFHEVVKALTLDPLGLKATGFTETPAAVSYATIDPPARKPNEVRTLLTLASGGYYSTAADLMKAGAAVFDGGFLKPETRKALTTIEAPQSDYALGGRVAQAEINGAKYAVGWETGRTIGYRSHLAYRLDTGDTVVILNNNDLQQSALSKLVYSLLPVAF